MSKSRVLNRDFFKTWSPDMAYVLGYFAADGSMIKNKRGGCFIEFTTTDKSLLTLLVNLTGATQRVSIRARTGGSGKWKTQYRIQIGSAEWFADLATLGFSQAKSRNLLFPPVPRKLLGDFIRGYFDGDGCVYFGKVWSAWHKKKVWSLTTRFTCGTRSFLVELHKRLERYGVRGGYMYEKNRGYELVLSRHDSLALYHLMYHTTDTLKVSLSRKRAKLAGAIKVLRLRV